MVGQGLAGAVEEAIEKAVAAALPGVERRVREAAERGIAAAVAGSAHVLGVSPPASRRAPKATSRKALPAAKVARAKKGPKAKRTPAPKLKRVAAKRKAVSTRHRERRSTEELQALEDAVLAQIEAAPGSTSEKLVEALKAKGLELTSKRIKLPLTRLEDAGKVRHEGAKRFTRYLPAKKKAEKK